MKHWCFFAKDFDRQTIVNRPTTSYLPSSKHPLSASFDVLVHQRAEIREREPAHVEAEELGGVTDAELEPDVRGRRVLQARVLDLACDVI